MNAKRTGKAIAVLAAATMLVGAAPAAAKKKQSSTGNYAGKTSGGSNITFKLAKGGKDIAAYLASVVK